MYFSPSTKCRYPAALRAEYEAAGMWPDDVVDIDEQLAAELQRAANLGHAIEPDGRGGFKVGPRPGPALEDVKSRCLLSIDRAADAARLAVAGDALRTEEYKIAESEAKTYRDAGYTGEVPRSVSSWAEAKGWTAREAADDICAEADAWNNALYSIRDARLKAKEAVRQAPDADTAQAIADAAIAGIQAQVADLGNARG